MGDMNNKIQTLILAAILLSMMAIGGRYWYVTERDEGRRRLEVLNSQIFHMDAGPTRQKLEEEQFNLWDKWADK